MIPAYVSIRVTVSLPKETLCNGNIVYFKDMIFYLSLSLSLTQVLTLPFCPESPKHLLYVRDNEQRTRAALEFYRGADAGEELDRMKVVNLCTLFKEESKEQRSIYMQCRQIRK